MSTRHIIQPMGIPLWNSLRVLIFYCTSIVLAQSCYFTSGVVAPDFTPCNGNASFTHCCKNGDACLSSGLCFMSYDHSINVGACTDQSWRDPSCFQNCPKSTAYKSSVTNTLYRCNDNNWCCSAGGNTTSCCNDPGVDNVLFNVGQTNIANGSAWAPGLTLVPISAVQTSLPTSSQTGLPTSSKSAQSCPTQTVVRDINSPAQNGGITLAEKDRDVDDKTKKVGLAVGFGVGVPLLVALATAIFLLWREKRAHQGLRQQVTSGMGHPVHEVSSDGWKKPNEIYARDERGITEMPTGGEVVSELQANQSAR